MHYRVAHKAGWAIYLKARALPAMLAAALVLTAYLHDGTSTLAVSLEEAKSITASYEGRAFIPPPRKIEDIRNLLDAASDRNRAELIALRARADAAVPTGWKGKKRAEALRDRATAAGEIGRLKQMITDLEAALDQGRWTPDTGLGAQCRKPTRMTHCRSGDQGAEGLFPLLQ